MSRATLVDTSAWIEAMRVRGDELLRARVRAILREGRARFSDFVLLELWNGIGGESERRWLSQMEQDVETVPTDARVWEEARSLARRSRLQGLTIPASDLLIAACARVHDLDLIHRDAHYDRLAEVVEPAS